jgi:4-amino-4-deoxy-L-arabinose transferase-like glycosyltransferase
MRLGGTVDSRRTAAGAAVVALGVALGAAAALAEDLGLEGGRGVQAGQVAGLLVAAALVLGGALLMRRSPLIVLLAAAVLLVGVLDAWSYRDTMGADGLQYIDIGEAYLDGDLDDAVNAYWSPLYSLLSGVTLAVFSPSPSDEFAAIRGANLVIYLAAAAAFALFVRELLRYRDAELSFPPGRRAQPTWMIAGVALVAFGWGVGRLIGAHRVTPDLLVAALWFAAMAMLVRSLRQPGDRRALVALGLTLGVAYLAKTALLPIGLGFVAVVASAGGLRTGLGRAAVVAGALAVVALPWAVVVSAESGGPTIGSTSQLNQAWYVSGSPGFAHIPAERPPPGLDHYPRRLLAEPPAFVLDRPARATFAPWYDPTYWYAGTEPSFDLGAQLDTVRDNLRPYRDMFRPAAGAALVAGLVVLLLVGARTREALSIARHWRLVAPAALGLVLYAAVHVEGRFVGAFLATIATVAYALLPLPDGRLGRVVAGVAVAAVVAVALWSNVEEPVAVAAGGREYVEDARRAAAADERAAGALRRRLPHRCRDVALVATPEAMVQTYLPRLARTRIRVAVTRPPRGWAMTPALRRALAERRVAVLLARGVPAGAARGWSRLGESDWYAHQVRGGCA